MTTRTHRFLAIAATLGVVVLTFVAPAAHAQVLKLSSGSYTASDSTYQNGTIYVGLDNNFSQTDGMGNPYNATLNVVDGGNVSHAFGYNSSTLNVSGGNVYFAGAQNSSTVNVSGGNVTFVSAAGDSLTNISGGAVYATGVFSPTAAVNFIGADLSFAHNGYGNNNPFNNYADFFTVSGTVGGTARSYDIYLYNPAGAGGTANSTPRQFTFNGAAPAVVPEAGTLALLLPALGALGTVIVRRRDARATK